MRLEDTWLATSEQLLVLLLSCRVCTSEEFQSGQIAVLSRWSL